MSCHLVAPLIIGVGVGALLFSCGDLANPGKTKELEAVREAVRLKSLKSVRNRLR